MASENICVWPVFLAKLPVTSVFVSFRWPDSTRCDTVQRVSDASKDYEPPGSEHHLCSVAGRCVGLSHDSWLQHNVLAD